MAFLHRPQYSMNCFDYGHQNPLPHLEYYQPPSTRLFDQHFGSELSHDEIISPVARLGPPSHNVRRPVTSGRSEVKCDKNSFQVNLDVQQFKPDEVKVKTVGNFIEIEGKHGEKEDEHGSVSRHFVRRYMIPMNAQPEDVQCHMSSDGVLQVQVARDTVHKLATDQHAIPIVHTGEPAIAFAQRNATHEVKRPEM